MTARLDDDALAKRSRRGDAAALATLYRRHAPALLDTLERTGLIETSRQDVETFPNGTTHNPGMLFDALTTRLVDAWQAEAGVKTYGEAVAAVMEFRVNEGETFDMTIDGWKALANTASHY